MTTKDPWIHLVKIKCRALAASYQKMQEERVSLLPTSTGEQLFQLGGEIAAYDLASCSLQRLLDILTDCSYERPSSEGDLRMVLDGLTTEVLFLGSVKGHMWGRGPLVGEASPNSKNYHRSQTAALGMILLAIAEMLGLVFTYYVASFVDEAQIQALDAQPYWSDITRRTCVAETCQRLSSEGKLDEEYSLIARDLLKIQYPRDIHGEEDRYRRCALPTLVRRLLVRDLIAFIADIRVECADRGRSSIAFGGCLSAAQTLLERRAVTIPLPERSLRMKIFKDTLPLLDKVGLAAVHSDPCLLCQTHDGHCDMWQVTFPEGTVFGEATQTEYDQLKHSYTFTPTLPAGLPDGWCISVDYRGIWEPDCPWTLAVFDLSEELTAAKGV